MYKRRCWLSFYHSFIFMGIMIAHTATCSQSYASATEQAEKISISSSKKMPFKLGLELQEISSLCKWALNDNLVQKKPIFTIRNHEGHKLWHVEIDTSDIEFVTEPFSPDQRLLLQQSAQSIRQSIEILTAMLTQEGIESVTFSQWTEQIHQTLGSLGYSIDFGEIMGRVAEEQIHKPSAIWKAVFNPQATIQHPLESTICLYFNLFGFDSPYTAQFVASLPGVDRFKDAMKRGDGAKFKRIFDSYINEKICGLAFLHALTLIRMTPTEGIADNDSMLLAETFASLKGSQQVDAKMKLSLMSRRPFSLMLEEIGCQGIYTTKFFIPMFMRDSQNIPGNRAFLSFYQVPTLFSKTNYGEQFFDPSTAQVKSLLGLIPFFDEAFLEENTNYEEKFLDVSTGDIKRSSLLEVSPDIARTLIAFRTNRDIVSALLEQGIISTTMVRNFKKSIKLNTAEVIADSFAKYYEHSVRSIDAPEGKRFHFDGSSMSLIPWHYDVLSPPLLQDLNNSMGRLNQGMSAEERQYGEAIVEIRSIRNVATRFLGSYLENPQIRLGEFLTTPDEYLEKEFLALFDFLNAFGDKNIVDFSAGLPYAVLRDGM